ncbi:MAG: DinB family protein, partial [Anaerolineales bacterium]
AHSEYAQPLPARIQMGAEESVEPWVVMLQAVNHATEHREQIKSMLSALGNTPPEVDGWTYGVVTGAFITSSD